MFDKVLVISGPTASGKSRLAETIYLNTPSIIINADALQIYDSLPVLTAKPKDYKERGKYVMYDYLPEYETCSVMQWVRLAETEIREAWSKNLLPIIVGGTGFYIQSLLYGLSDVPLINKEEMCSIKERYEEMGKEKFFESVCKEDPNIASRVHINDTYRLLRAAAVFKCTGKSIYSYLGNEVLRYQSCLHLFLEPNRENLYQWCNERVDQMFNDGVLEEVQEFLERKKNQESYAVEKAIGYKQIVQYLKGEISLEIAKENMKQFTRNYAKRQYTWFRNQVNDKVLVQYDQYRDIEDNTLKKVIQFVESH